MGCGSELRSHVPRERSQDCRMPAGRAPRGWAALRGEDHRPPAVRRWENGGGNSRGPRRAGTGAPPAGSSPRTRQGCLCHGARGCRWLPHERAGEDWGWAGVVHRDREGCLHTSLSTSGVQKAGGPGPPYTSSALADSRQIQRPCHLEQQVRTSSWSPEGSQLSALTTSHGRLGTQSAQHLHPGASETHCPAHSDAHGAAPGQA